ncbi:MAG TPA: undecaprenyl-diphosphate phosphatase [Solirubrobacteraceae bacterium]|jgi:undecaprenyl-diphosphatase|nr:undecaprenyl-diphosphate phosphatase [Solirubrobacteraceae bacterium]
MRRAILLGLLQGPTEMTPVSSSAHTALLQRSLGRSSQDHSFEKSFEVALHGGTALALALQMGGRLRRSGKRACADADAQASKRRLTLLGLSALPPALAGYLLEGPIERRGSGSQSIAAGLVVGAVAMGIADRRGGQRRIEQAGAADALALGLAQASALMPGVSRRGATLAAARLRGFSRADADELSWLVAIPVILGACALKGSQLLRKPPSGEQRVALLAGASTAFASTLASAQVQSRLRMGRWPLAPFCVYRLLLALWTLRGRSDDPPGS